jgi:Ankyrin repeats (3 copies)
VLDTQEINQSYFDQFETPFCLTATLGNDSLFHIALPMCADIEKEASRGWTALHLAAQSRHLKAVQLLVGRGAEANQANGDNWAALHLAVDHQHDLIMRLLIPNGVNVK